MENLRNYFREMDFEAFGSGGFSLPAESMPRLIKKRALFIDLRSMEEVQGISLPFAINIPINELPDRLDEVPEDTQVIVFSSGSWRSSVAMVYLTAKGFDHVYAITQGLAEMIKYIKPGPLFGAGVQKPYIPEVQRYCDCEKCC